ncbi:MAG: peptidoglycan bridge formation glycyltransferase FemA/FemB family protein [Clostridia bacterium]|nr:peptidoglycan bridge formation glycyltransferase FemA/FemB family protein [Clostridia bacterium]
MEYKILPETDLNAFEEFVLSHGGNYLHSVKWSLVKKEWNSRFYSGFSESGERVLTALVMERKIPFAGKIWYCPSGALFDYKNEDLLQAFSVFMKKELKKNRVTALFYDPLIPLRINGEKREEGKSAHDALIKNGFILNTDASKTLYKSPVQLITPLVSPEGERFSPEKLLKSFEKGVRYSVRVGEGRGLTEEIYTIEDIEKDPEIMEDFLSVMRDTSERSDFVERGGDYCKRIMEVFGKEGLDMMLIYYDKNRDKALQEEKLKRRAELLSALETAPEKKIRGIKEEIDSIDKGTAHFEERMRETENEKDRICVSGGMTLHYGGMSSCLFGGSRNILRNNLRASHFFNYRRICHSIEKGNSYHDLGYVLLEKTPPEEDGTLGICKAAPDFEGILSFKKSFGSDYIEFIGEYVLVSDKLLYFSYKNLLDKIRGVQSILNRIIRKFR